MRPRFSTGGKFLKKPINIQVIVGMVIVSMRIMSPLNPTSSFRETKLFLINGIGFLLVTIWGLRPGVLGGHDLRRDGELLIELLDVRLGSCGLSDAQT